MGIRPAEIELVWNSTWFPPNYVAHQVLFFLKII